MEYFRSYSTTTTTTKYYSYRLFTSAHKLTTVTKHPAARVPSDSHTTFTILSKGKYNKKDSLGPAHVYSNQTTRQVCGVSKRLGKACSSIPVLNGYHPAVCACRTYSSVVKKNKFWHFSHPSILGLLYSVWSMMTSSFLFDKNSCWSPNKGDETVFSSLWMTTTSPAACARGGSPQ